MRFTTCGSVDDGKSTLIGRLLYDSRVVFSDHLESARRLTTRAHISEAGEEVDFSLLVDGLKAELEQGITIDVAYRYFATPRRRFVIADTPGHEQYTRNMATGASTASLALVILDASKGVLTQTRRHAFICSLLGIRHCILCVNKMDLVDYDPQVFERIREEFISFAARLDFPDLEFVPISALKGDNVVTRSERMPWYEGMPLLTLLERVNTASDRNLVDLRFPVQYVSRPNDAFRGYCGQVASGVLRPGEEVMVLPSRRTTRVKALVSYDGELPQAFPPMCPTVTLEDELDVSRGDLIVRPHNQPRVGRQLDVMMVWMAEDPPQLATPGRYLLKHLTQTTPCRLEQVRYVMDVETLSRRKDTRELALNAIGRVSLTTTRPLYYDAYKRNRASGCLILIDTLSNATLAAGMILDRQPAPAPAPKTGQAAFTVWFTGLPASGKTTLANALAEELRTRGRPVVVLDGDTLRAGLNTDLGFSPEHRSENIRRVTELAKLLNDSGVIALVACISPYAADRQAARERIGPERFHLVYVSTPLEVCRQRDPKGLYAKAAAGEITDLTGVSAPYETPENVDLELKSDPSREIELSQLLGVVFDDHPE